MTATGNIVHRASALKQQNKKHNKLGHRTKGQVTSLSKGRVNIATIKKIVKNNLSKEQRRNQAKQIQIQKRQETFNKKRHLGTSTKPPFLVCIVPMHEDIDTKLVLSNIISNNDLIDTQTSEESVYHCCCPKLKQRFSFVIAPTNDLYALLDAAKVCDTILYLWKFDEEVTEETKNLINSLKHQAMPSTVHAVIGDQNLGQKRRIRAEKELRVSMSSLFMEKCKLYSIEKEQDILLLFRQIGSQKRKDIGFRDRRTHMIAENMKFHTAKEGTTGLLAVEGYLRGQPLSVNDLIHIPGIDSFQIDSIYSKEDPHSMNARKGSASSQDMISDDLLLLEKSDPSLQESLKSVIDVDDSGPLMESSSDSGTEDDEDETTKVNKQQRKRVPKGTSDYQAAWIVSDDEDGSDEDDDKMSIMSESMAPRDENEFSSDNDSCDGDDDDEEEEEYETINMTETGDDYDGKYDFDEEMDDMEKFKAAGDDRSYPDEIDTPMTGFAKDRFAKYRGLESFRTSPWDIREDLPEEYNRIYQFPRFRHIKNKILKEEKEGIEPGTYVVIVLKDVPKHIYDEHISNPTPFVMFSMLKYEQKMTLLNVVLKSFSPNHHYAIRSKEKLIFHIGITRFCNNPIFSEHTNGSKHKFSRFFHPGNTVMATMFAPVTYSPCPVTVYQKRLDGSQVMVASGSVFSVNANRIICKRVVLTGHPFKVNKKSAVIRYMFFNPTDVNWFKAIELRTKWGKKGHIMEPLGTHGHIKCRFNGQMKSQDTVMMSLYKRVFPKWSFDPHVDRPSLSFGVSSERASQNPILQGGSLFDDTEPRPKKKVRFTK